MLNPPSVIIPKNRRVSTMMKPEITISKTITEIFARVGFVIVVCIVLLITIWDFVLSSLELFLFSPGRFIIIRLYRICNNSLLKYTLRIKYVSRRFMMVGIAKIVRNVMKGELYSTLDCNQEILRITYWSHNTANSDSICKPN